LGLTDHRRIIILPTMKKVILLFLLLVSQSFSQLSDTLKRAVLPIVKISAQADQNGLRYKFPCGTALLVFDKSHYYDRLFLVTAKHVIEKDSATECVINFSRTSDTKKAVVTTSKKYTIYRDEWKFHKSDKKVISGEDTSFYTYDIAIAEIYIARIRIDGESLWHEPLSIDNFSTTGMSNDDSVKILAFPFVDKFNWQRGLTLGDLEEDKGIQRFSMRKSVTFEKKKYVMDLNEIYIENPKFRPGYSGGLVFYSDAGTYKFSGVSMGMTNIVKKGNRQFCYGFYIKAENLKDALFFNFK
jgi:hypothetical protein